jgi:ubiquinone/menaquinone biosynthesis C-methylase UbiE
VASGRLHSVFRQPQWREIRVDIDEDAKPDIVASIVDLASSIGDGSCDAVWASHVIEHVDTHAVPRALSEVHRVLSPRGFAVVRCPDIEQVARFIVEGRLTDAVYQSPVGPITPLDMIYGHSSSIARGRTAMRHCTAFTAASLASALLTAGFSEVRTMQTEHYEIWAVAFREKADIDGCIDSLAQAGTVFRQ